MTGEEYTSQGLRTTNGFITMGCNPNPYLLPLQSQWFYRYSRRASIPPRQRKRQRVSALRRVPASMDPSCRAVLHLQKIREYHFDKYKETEQFPPCPGTLAPRQPAPSLHWTTHSVSPHRVMYSAAVSRCRVTSPHMTSPKRTAPCRWNSLRNRDNRGRFASRPGFATLEHVKAQASIMVCVAMQREIPSGASFVERKSTVHEERRGRERPLVCLRALKPL
jgi:hypothetical protein